MTFHRTSMAKALRGLVLAAAIPALAVTTAQPAAACTELPIVYAQVDPQPVAPGGTAMLRVLVANGGPEATTAPFTVIADLPQGAAADVEGAFPDSCRHTAAQEVSCEFPAMLKPGRNAITMIPIRIGADVQPGSTLCGSVRLSGADDPTAVDRPVEFTIQV